MNVKLIAFDLDGTVLLNHRNIPEENIKAMKYAHEKGVYVVPATGRIASFLPSQLLNVDFIEYALTCNGGSIDNIKTKQCVHGAYINGAIARKVNEVLKKYNLYIEYYVKGGIPYTKTITPERAMIEYGLPEQKRYFLSKDYIYFNDIEEFLADDLREYEKINVTFIPEYAREDIRNGLKQIPEIITSSSLPDNLEINSVTSGKGNSLIALCDYLNIDIKNAMAIGDGENDLPMLKVAGISVAMGNSCEKALKTAKYKTTDCDDCGFAKAVYDFV
ncbi:MAG: Cof-type HAD-IIB family hydrolase [Clostridia bacterium]